MLPSRTWVVKLGGALLTADELPAWLAACAGAPGLTTRCVIVCGGGALADAVRSLQVRWHFDDALAHELALDTMRINARLLHGLAPGLPVCAAICAENLAQQSGRGGLLWSPPPGFAPRELPASWAVTSDSIALWLAQALGAEAVLLVKSVPAAALRAGHATSFAAQGVVDEHFPKLLAQGRLPARVIGKTGARDFERHLLTGSLPGVSVD